MPSGSESLWVKTKLIAQCGVSELFRNSGLSSVIGKKKKKKKDQPSLVVCLACNNQSWGTVCSVQGPPIGCQGWIRCNG